MKVPSKHFSPTKKNRTKCGKVKLKVLFFYSSSGATVQTAVQKVSIIHHVMEILFNFTEEIQITFSIKAVNSKARILRLFQFPNW